MKVLQTTINKQFWYLTLLTSWWLKTIGIFIRGNIWYLTGKSQLALNVTNILEFYRTFSPIMMNNWKSNYTTKLKVSYVFRKRIIFNEKLPLKQYIDFKQIKLWLNDIPFSPLICNTLTDFDSYAWITVSTCTDV